MIATAKKKNNNQWLLLLRHGRWPPTAANLSASRTAPSWILSCLPARPTSLVLSDPPTRASTRNAAEEPGVLRDLIDINMKQFQGGIPISGRLLEGSPFPRESTLKLEFHLLVESRLLICNMGVWKKYNEVSSMNHSVLLTCVCHFFHAG